MKIIVNPSKNGWITIVKFPEGNFGREFHYKKDANTCKTELKNAGEIKIRAVYGLFHYLHPIISD